MLGDSTGKWPRVGRWKQRTILVAAVIIGIAVPATFLGRAVEKARNAARASGTT